MAGMFKNPKAFCLACHQELSAMLSILVGEPTDVLFYKCPYHPRSPVYFKEHGEYYELVPDKGTS